MPAARPALGLLPAALAVALSGCREPEQVRRYSAERVEPPKQHLIAAIFKQPEKVWFIKLDGPEPLVKEHKVEFEKLVQSVRFPAKGDEPITWELPKGWTRVEVKKEFRHATLRLPKKGDQQKPLEAVVTPLGKESADLLPNVNRWRQQVGLPPTTEDRLGQVMRQVEVAGEKVTVVEMTGPGLKLVSTSPMLARHRAANQPRANFAVPVFKAPEGWAELPPDRISLVAYRAGKGEAAAKVTVTPMPGNQDVAANINRWRGQINLPEAKEEAIHAALREVETAGGGKARLVDLAGPEQHIVGAILTRDDVDWFFKMTGPAATVEREKAAFEDFVRSVKFEQGGEK